MIFIEDDVIDLYRRRDYHNWEMIYIYEGKLGVTYHRSNTLAEAIEWLSRLGIEDIVDAGLGDEGSWRFRNEYVGPDKV